jgi:hypothetical protein
MFRAHSTLHQDDDANCTYAAFLNGCTRHSHAERDDTRGCIYIICVLDFLMLGGMRSKYVEEFKLL